MLKELTKTMYGIEDNHQTQSRFKQTLRFFEGKLNNEQTILDVGNRNPFTDFLESNFNVKIDNTIGDLDEAFDIPKPYYDVIIYSHTLEHQFNPLSSLLKLNRVMDDKSFMYVMLPERGKLLWCKGHFHEIDDYRFQLLIKRAGLKIIGKTKNKVWRNWTKYLTGIRPLYRLIREFNTTYTIIKT